MKRLVRLKVIKECPPLDDTRNTLVRLSSAITFVNLMTFNHDPPVGSSQIVDRDLTHINDDTLCDPTR